MSQLRLTAKMAKKLKILVVGFPSDNYPKLYDNWYWDITRILRRKVFIFMHIRIRIGLAIPAYEIGSTSGLLECFHLLLRECFYKLGFDKIADEAYNFLTASVNKIHFVKTDNKSILRYISNFKLLLDFEARKANVVSQVLCDLTAKYWLKHLTKDPTDPKNYTTPLELAKALFMQKP